MQTKRGQMLTAPFRSGGNLSHGSSCGSSCANLNNDLGNVNWNYGARNFVASSNRHPAAGVISGSVHSGAPTTVKWQNKHGAQGLVGGITCRAKVLAPQKVAR